MTSLRTWCTVVIAAAVAAFLTCPGSGEAAPCNQEILVGQPMDEVAALCQLPTLKDKRDLWEEESDGKTKKRTTTTYEEWIFDTGAQEFMQSIIFLNGKVAETRLLGYGSMRDPMMPNCRNGEGLAVGDTMVDAYLKCGEPLAREKQADKVVESTDGEITRRTSVAVTDWTYRYGRDLPGYTIRFEDGRATDIRQREFGK